MPRHSEATLAAIKQRVDIVALVGESLRLHRAGSKFKAVCPFHDDHNPSLEINPERQSFKCWSCGAGGDVFDFVKDYHRVDFGEALRMLADKAGVILEAPEAGSAPKGPSRTELLAITAWAEQAFVDALGRTAEAKAYVAERGISPESAERFRLGYAPDARDWLLNRARQTGLSSDLLERAGLLVRPEDSPQVVRERFRGRLIFPIHDLSGKTLGFGGRVLPYIERGLAADGKKVAKYLNSSETVLFQKRRLLYGADLARNAAREAGWVAVVEGYTDVIAAHQAGIENVVAALGTALGDDHVPALRRLADRVVLVFDGDEAGQKAAERGLELFLGQEIDLRVLTLPPNIDPCDFLQQEGADAFRTLIERAMDPLAFAIRRAEAKFPVDSIEGARQGAEWVLGIIARIPKTHRLGLDLKVAKALDALSDRLGVSVEKLDRWLGQLRRSAPPARKRPTALGPAAEDALENGSVAAAVPIPVASLDRTDRELLQIILNEPNVVGRLISRVAVATIRDAPLRAILQTCYDLHGEGSTPTFDRVALRLEDPALRSLAIGLLLPIDRAPLPEGVQPAPWEDCLAGVLASLAERERSDRLRNLKQALDETDAQANPDDYRALQIEYRRLMNQRPDTKKTRAS